MRFDGFATARLWVHREHRRAIRFDAVIGAIADDLQGVIGIFRVEILDRRHSSDPRP